MIETVGMKDLPNHWDIILRVAERIELGLTNPYGWPLSHIEYTDLKGISLIGFVEFRAHMVGFTFRQLDQFPREQINEIRRIE